MMPSFFLQSDAFRLVGQDPALGNKWPWLRIRIRKATRNFFQARGCGKRFAECHTSGTCNVLMRASTMRKEYQQRSLRDVVARSRRHDTTVQKSSSGTLLSTTSGPCEGHAVHRFPQKLVKVIYYVGCQSDKTNITNLAVCKRSIRTASHGASLQGFFRVERRLVMGSGAGRGLQKTHIPWQVTFLRKTAMSGTSNRSANVGKRAHTTQSVWFSVSLACPIDRCGPLYLQEHPTVHVCLIVIVVVIVIIVAFSS